MRLSEKKDFTGLFEEYELFDYDYRKTDIGSMNFMNCLATCLKNNNCKYFKYGNTTGSYINYSEMKNCTIWTPDP